MRSFAVLHGQVPVAFHIRDEMRVLNLQVGELQRAHLGTIGLVLFLVPVERRLPAFGDLVAGLELQLLAVSIATHEAFEVAVVPARHLIIEDFADIRFRVEGCARHRATQ